MPNLSLTWIMPTYLTFLFLFYFPWVLNLEELEPRYKTLWFHFELYKDNTYHSSTFELFKQEDKFICWMTKQDKQTTSQVNTSWDFQNWNTYNATLLHLKYSIEILNVPWCIYLWGCLFVLFLHSEDKLSFLLEYIKVVTMLGIILL